VGPAGLHGYPDLPRSRTSDDAFAAGLDRPYTAAPCLALTFYYSQIVAPGGEDSDSFLPTTSYAFVLLLLNLDLIGFVVLLLLLSRNLIKAYFERTASMFGAGFRTKLVAAFIGFSLIPTVLLALVASGW